MQNSDLFHFLEPNHRTSVLYQKFSGALSEFLGSIDQTKYLAVVLCGSLARNRIRPDSDIDILLVLPPDSGDREDFREVSFSGIPIQLFASTEADLQGAFDWERKSSNRQRSSLVAHGVSVAGDKSVADRVVQQAREAFESLPLAMDQRLAAFVEVH